MRIAVVFATMERATVAVGCVRALAAQVQAPEWVVVADNDPAGGTAVILEAERGLPFALEVLRMAKNRGNAGGVEEAMAKAFALGADGVWILDDDSWPRAEALAALLKDGWDDEVVRHSLQVDPRTGKFTWPLQVADGCGRWGLAWEEAGLPAEGRIWTRGMWTGAIVPRRVWEEAGPVFGDLFIRGEDEEYPWRIERAGFRFEAVRGAVLDHPGPADLLHWHLGGRHFFYERGLADWKWYYKVRNMVWLKRRQGGLGAALAMAAAYGLAAILLDGPGRLPIMGRALRDAGKLGDAPAGRR